MPSYEEIINQSQDNLKSLSEKLKDLDKLHQDIKELIKQPEIFDTKYQQIVKLSEDYTNTIGAASKKYLDGNNVLFTTKLHELSSQIKDFETEITRLTNTDFSKLFRDLQKVFIDQTRKDIEVELKRFEERSKDLQNKIEELKKQIGRLEQIDLEKHFDRFQKTLSEIFGSINAINLTLTGITQNLNAVVQSLGTIQATIDASQKETRQLINSLSETILKNLTDQDLELKKNGELIKLLIEQNQMLKKDIKGNRIIYFLGFGLLVIILIYLILIIQK
jgi:hypothetical protein